MGGYNSKVFSKQFSQRTKKNLEYVKKTVNRDEEEIKIQEDFLAKYKDVINDVIMLTNEVRREANGIVNIQKHGKNELKAKLHSIASKIDTSKNDLEQKLKALVSKNELQDEKLYEVTQLLNSLMGIAVLPYEMYKDYFKSIIDVPVLYNSSGKTLSDIKNIVKYENEYFELQSYIMQLYDDKKWKTTFLKDLKNGHIADGIINKDIIVFQFLYHLRNVVCHSGDNALSILPLDDGKIINEVLFYDHYNNQEFAMKITIEELQKLVELVSNFYCNTTIGSINKTEAIKNAEQKAMALLNKNA